MKAIYSTLKTFGFNLNEVSISVGGIALIQTVIMAHPSEGENLLAVITATVLGYCSPLQKGKFADDVRTMFLALIASFNLQPSNLLLKCDVSTSVTMFWRICGSIYGITTAPFTAYFGATGIRKTAVDEWGMDLRLDVMTVMSVFTTWKGRSRGFEAIQLGHPFNVTITMKLIDRRSWERFWDVYADYARRTSNKVVVIGVSCASRRCFSLPFALGQSAEEAYAHAITYYMDEKPIPILTFAIAQGYTSVNNNLAFIIRMLGYFRRQQVEVIIPRIRFDSATQPERQAKVILISHLLRSYGIIFWYLTRGLASYEFNKFGSLLNNTFFSSILPHVLRLHVWIFSVFLLKRISSSVLTDTSTRSCATIKTTIAA